MCELVVDKKRIVPIRAIPAYTGNFVNVRDVAGLLYNPESYGCMSGIGMVAYYRDGQGLPQTMWPYEFCAMAGQIEHGLGRGDAEPDLLAAILPGIFVYRSTLERCLYGFWRHYAEVWGGDLGRGEFEFNPAPRFSPTEALLVFAGFEDLRGTANGPGGSSSHADRLEEVRRVLRRLLDLASAANIRIEPRKMPGRCFHLIALVKRHSSVMCALTDDVVADYVNEAGYLYGPGRPRTGEAPHPLYSLM
jgi:hypothetical protein